MQLSEHADLQSALSEALRFGPNYRVGGRSLSSHLPMVLAALARLDAPAKSLQAHLTHWAARLPAAEPVPDLSVEQALPDLMLAPESAAFHGAIRLAYAVQAGHAGEQIAALAAWADSRFSLGPALPATAGAASLRSTLDAVRAHPEMALALPAGASTITAEMKAAAALPRFNDYLLMPRLSIDDLAEASLAAYLSTRHFTALHLITGLHALRVLLTQAKVEEGQVLRHAWRAWLAAYVSIGRPALAWAAVHAGHASEADWQDQLPELHASMNDHRIKLADTAREEWRHRGWPGYALCLQAQGAAR